MSETAVNSELADAGDFDFEAHRETAVGEYRKVFGSYSDFSGIVRNLLTSALSNQKIKPHSIESRGKSEESFGDKASRPSDTSAAVPKYRHPLDEIHDLAGCRVITFFLQDVQKVRQVIEAEFKVVETANRSSYLRSAGGPGYESYHFVVELTTARLALPEYARFTGLRVEIQVRTILQHAWAEIEHDIQYKSVDVLPAEIGQRFTALAGMIEIGDREFQAIADAHEKVRQAAVISLENGKLSDVELTPETLKAYLDQRYGPDGRMRDWSYSWTTRILKRFGFRNLQELADCIAPYNDDAVSRAVWNSRQGQLNRLEAVVMASTGSERWKALHPFAGSTGPDWFEAEVDEHVAALEAAGIAIGTYTPGTA